MKCVMEDFTRNGTFQAWNRIFGKNFGIIVYGKVAFHTMPCSKFTFSLLCLKKLFFCLQKIFVFFISVVGMKLDM